MTLRPFSKRFIDLKRLYQVSGAALLIRLQAIGIISEATLTYSFQSIARYWRTTEPEELEVASEHGKKEQAWRFSLFCYRALAEGLISLSKAAELLRKPIHEVEARLKKPQTVIVQEFEHLYHFRYNKCWHRDYDGNNKL